MINITNVQDSYLIGKIKWERFIKKTASLFIAPEIKLQLKIQLSAIPPEIKAMIDQETLARLELILEE